MEMVLNDFEVLNQSEMEEIDGGKVTIKQAIGYGLVAVGLLICVIASANH